MTGPRSRPAHTAAAVTWRWLRGTGAVVVAIAAVEYGVIPFLVHARTELSLLGQVSWQLLVAAVVLESASRAAYTQLTQTLIGSSTRLSFGTQWRIDLV
ncbi:MAG TPA: hypothetical protein VH912_28215, partial [Streptosporangiaceae bacterium]